VTRSGNGCGRVAGENGRERRADVVAGAFQVCLAVAGELGELGRAGEGGLVAFFGEGPDGDRELGGRTGSVCGDAVKRAGQHGGCADAPGGHDSRVREPGDERSVKFRVDPYGVGQQVGCPVPEVFMSRLSRVGERGAGDGGSSHAAVAGTGPVRLPAWKRPDPVDDDRRGAGQFYVEVPLGFLG
jgi:hypothetical protein